MTISCDFSRSVISIYGHPINAEIPSQQADENNDGYLDFPGFRRFVKLLKSRPELEQLYQKLAAANGNKFDFVAFEKFMRDSQKVRGSLSDIFRFVFNFPFFSVYSQPRRVTSDIRPICVHWNAQFVASHRCTSRSTPHSYPVCT